MVSLRKDYELLTDTMVPQPQNVSKVMGKTSVPTPQSRNLGDVMAPASQPSGAGGADFETRVARNESFLADPSVQSSLLDFAISIMSPGMTTEESQKQQQLDMMSQQNMFENQIAQKKLGHDERQVDIQEQQLQLNAMDTQDKLLKNKIAERTLNRRQTLFSQLQQGGKLEDLDGNTLLDLAGDLMGMGDEEGAKVAISMADTNRQMKSTGDIVEYKLAVEQGYQGTFTQWQGQKIKAGVPPGPTAGIPDVLIKAAMDLNTNADALDQQGRELQETLDLAAKSDTGFMAPLTLPIKAAFLDMGIHIGDSETEVNLLQTLAAAQGSLALRMRNPESGFGLTGSTSDRDLKFLQQTVGSISNTKEANMAILTGMIAKQRWSAEVAREHAEYIYVNKGEQGWGKYIANKMKDREIFTADEREFLERLSNPNKPPIGQPEAPLKNDTLPKIAPDNLPLSKEDRLLWPRYSDEMKKSLMGNQE